MDSCSRKWLQNSNISSIVRMKIQKPHLVSEISSPACADGLGLKECRDGEAGQGFHHRGRISDQVEYHKGRISYQVEYL